MTAISPIQSQGLNAHAHGFKANVRVCTATIATRMASTTDSIRSFRLPGRWGRRQVGEQPAQVPVGLGPHGLIEPLLELGLVQPSVPVVRGQEVRDLGAFGVGDPQVAVAAPAAGGGQERWAALWR